MRIAATMSRPDLVPDGPVDSLASAFDAYRVVA
jgi:hypothetical protein